MAAMPKKALSEKGEKSSLSEKKGDCFKATIDKSNY